MIMTQTAVLKFGGTSVATTEKIMALASKIASRHQSGERMVIVVSAMGKSTDTLVSLAQAISKTPDKREMDLLLSTGEQVTIALMSLALKQVGVPAKALTGWQAGIKTDTVHSKARIKDISKKELHEVLDSGAVAVVAGFQGITECGEITTLGRGGSDTTAVAIAAALGCDCEIYTDVEGIYTTDPRIFHGAKKHSQIAYSEMLEMASTGAGVMETRAIEIAHRHNVRIRVGLNDMLTPGTWIMEADKMIERNAVTGLSINTDCLMTTIENFPLEYTHIANLFNALAEKNVIVDMISQTAPVGNRTTISFTAGLEDYQAISTLLNQFPNLETSTQVAIDSDVAKLSVVGIGMISQSGVAARLFNLLNDANIPFYQVTTSEISISYTIPKALYQRAVHTIAQAFNL